MDRIEKIFIVQSLKVDDPQSGLILSKKLQHIIPTHCKTVGNKSELVAYLELFAENINPEKQFVLHFDCHGDDEGFGLFDANNSLTYIPFEDLRDTFRNLYLVSERKLWVSFSSCQGFNMAKFPASLKPCIMSFLTGSLNKIPFQDSIDGFFLFYKNYNNSMPTLDNVKEVATLYPALNPFFAMDSEQLFITAWIAYKMVQTPENIKKRKEYMKAQVIQAKGFLTPELERGIEESFTEMAEEQYYNLHLETYFS